MWEFESRTLFDTPYRRVYDTNTFYAVSVLQGIIHKQKWGWILIRSGCLCLVLYVIGCRLWALACVWPYGEGYFHWYTCNQIITPNNSALHNNGWWLWYHNWAMWYTNVYILYGPKRRQLLMDSSGTRVCSQRKTRTIMICGLKRGISGCFSWGITWRKGLLYIHFSSFYSHNVAKSFKW